MVATSEGDTTPGEGGFIYPVGRGYWRAMMDACKRWLADRGVPKLNLMVRASNEAVGPEGWRFDPGYVGEIAMIRRDTGR